MSDFLFSNDDFNELVGRFMARFNLELELLTNRRDHLVVFDLGALRVLESGWLFTLEHYYHLEPGSSDDAVFHRIIHASTDRYTNELSRAHADIRLRASLDLLRMSGVTAPFFGPWPCYRNRELPPKTMAFMHVVCDVLHRLGMNVVVEAAIDNVVGMSQRYLVWGDFFRLNSPGNDAVLKPEVIVSLIRELRKVVQGKYWAGPINQTLYEQVCPVAAKRSELAELIRRITEDGFAGHWSEGADIWKDCLVPGSHSRWVFDTLVEQLLRRYGFPFGVLD